MNNQNMEGKLLESKLNSIFEKKNFGAKSKLNKNRSPTQNGSINPATNGIFVSHYYLVLELEDEDQKTTSPIEQQKQDNSIPLDSSTITVSPWLWILDISAISPDEQLSYKVPLTLQNQNVISLFPPSRTGLSTPIIPTPLKLSANQGETTLSLVSSPVDPFQIAVYTSKQIFTGSIKEFITQLKTLKANSPIPALKMQQVENIIGKYSPNIISIKFHKLSSQYLAILTDNGLFTIFNLSETRIQPQIQWNMKNIPRYGTSGEFYLEDTESSVNFIDFEFGGSPKLTAQQEQQYNNNPLDLSQVTVTTTDKCATQRSNIQQPLTSITDFDFLAVYFLTNSGKIFYQSPLILPNLHINRDYLQQFEQYLISEIDLVQQYERNSQKLQALNEYLRILSILDQSDYLEQNSLLSHQSNLSNQNQIKIQLQYVEILEDSKQDEQLQSSSKLSSDSKLSKSSQLKHSSNVTKLRSYSTLSKVETQGGCLHAFLVTKDGNLLNKNYATVQILFSSLPAMPTHFIQKDFTFKLMKAEKARLQIQSTQQSSLGNNSDNSLPQKSLFKTNSPISIPIHPRLLSRDISQQTLDSICISLSNRVYCVNFAWTKQLLDSYLEDPNVLTPHSYNDKGQLDNNSYQRYGQNNNNIDRTQVSSVRAIVELKQLTQEKQIDFYAVSQLDKMIIMIFPQQAAANQQVSQQQQPQSFKLRCFSLSYLPDYRPIQEQAKVISDKFSSLLAAAAITQEPQVSNSMLQTVTQHERALETNKKTLDKLLQDPKISLKNFETEAKDFLNDHEQIIKRNVQLVYQRYAEATKANEQFEKKKQEVETNILTVLTSSRDQLEETQKKIMQNNSNILNKLNEITGIVQQLNNSKEINQNNIIGKSFEGTKPLKQISTRSESAIGRQAAHALYERLLALKVQYQTYFSKRQNFLEQIGQTAQSKKDGDYTVDKYLLDAAQQASKVLRQHTQGLERRSLNGEGLEESRAK